jgi:hypothetical protein
MRHHSHVVLFPHFRRPCRALEFDNLIISLRLRMPAATPMFTPSNSRRNVR